MPKDNQPDPRHDFAPRYLPWLLGGVMFVVYALTLNHWVTLLNISQVAATSGWTWLPQVNSPLLFLVTFPVRLLPAAWIPIALNLLSAACAAATLAILARSVAILPHDRTEMERARERSDFSFLTGWVAWIPPVVAVIFGGLQVIFWEHATSFSGESVNVLCFAIILWQLLEFRMDEEVGRLYLSAFVYGASLANNWGMTGFIPLYLIMILWLRRLDFFSARFLLKLTLSGLAGLLLLLLTVPLSAVLTGEYSDGIWVNLKLNLHADWQALTLISVETVRHHLAMMALTSIFPAIIISIRWSSSFGDSSRIGATLVNYIMHLVNMTLLGILLWVTFDPPFSPHRLLSATWANLPALSIHYITVLCISYFCGYLLLVFGKKPIASRRTSRPDPALPGELLWLCPVIVTGTLVSMLVAAALLIYHNAPAVMAINDDSLLKYAHFTAQTLPADGAILLSDSDNPNQDLPIHTYLLQAVLAREGRADKFAVVDTKSLIWPPYRKYLHHQFPRLWPAAATNDVSLFSPSQVLTLLGSLAQSNHLCYLNPSFGYYFEKFYQEPHGLTYALKTLPEDTLLPPPLDGKLIAENASFWKQLLEDNHRLIDNLSPPAQRDVISRIFHKFHVPNEENPNAVQAVGYYSHSLDCLGVQVQRAGDLNLASTLFSNACLLNSNNIPARVNLAFNQTLRAGLPTGNINPVTSDQYGDWNRVLTTGGTFDDTSFCFQNGLWFMQGIPRLMNQAAFQFNRVRQLAPDNLDVRLFLAQIYLTSHLPVPALEVLHAPLMQPARFGLGESNTTELNVLAAAAYLQNHNDDEAVKLLEGEIRHHPDDDTLLFVSAQVFNMRGLYTNALRIIDRKLARTPDDPTWLYGKGYLSLQIGALKDSITALNHYLQLQTNNPAALFDRALAYFQSDRLDDARADFLALQATHSNSFQVAYGLGEVAWRQHQTNEVVRNYRIYLANAPANAVEIKTVRGRLTALGVR